MEVEGLEIWSCGMTSGRQRVDTQGAVPDKPFLVKPVASVVFIVHNTRDRSM